MRVAERVARTLITIGGIGTIVAVTTICVFLISVVWPLFGGAQVQPAEGAVLPLLQTSAARHMAVDEFQSLGWVLLDDGRVAAFRVSDGQVLSVRPLREDARLTAVHVAVGDRRVAAGYADGRVVLAEIGFTTRFVDADAAPPEWQELQGEDTRIEGETVVRRSSEQQFRVQSLNVAADEPFGEGAAVVALTHSASEARTVVAVLRGDGSLRRQEVRRRRNMLTGKVTAALAEHELPPPPAEAGPPLALLQTELADFLTLVWSDGRVLRIDARDPAAASIAEITDVLPDSEASVTAVVQLVGSTTLVVGDSQGGLRAWFATRADPRLDRAVLSLAHELPAGAAAVTSLAPATRTRSLAAGFADGEVALYHVTSGQRLGAARAATSVDRVVLAPRGDGLLALGGAAMERWRLDVSHPETTLATLFLPVFYEGESGPAHVWQSSSGTDDFEPKLGLWPLIFGTLKASLYSLIFSVPLALLAAVYTSEFMSRRLRARIKPMVETMASLPSVVLGFLAAIVVAPLVEGIVPQILAAFVTVPLAFLFGARLWQLLPQRVALRLAGVQRFVAMGLAVGFGVLAGWLCGPLLERTLFAGDLRAWLDGQRGTATGGWWFLTLPAALLVCGLLRARVISPVVRQLSAGWSRERSALFDLAQFVVGTLFVFGLAHLAALLLSTAGFDPRGSYLDTYVQRNALVVGFLIGFAVIPIIYTLAEDALSSVPEHLRAASLAAGATPWQTAVRVVVPTAMSGLFSAVMIGVGRVVGETMIVLMAAGNTPVMDWNVFNGFRTLSATIAVELPEAVQGGTLFRVLFLAALTLFAMTFVINTIAEIVRLRFRKRAYEL